MVYAPGRSRARSVRGQPGGASPAVGPAARPAPLLSPTTARALDSVTAIDTAPRPAVRFRPEYASGALWVRPLPFSPTELRDELRRNHVQLVDSAVTALVQAFLDSVAADPASRAARVPSWVTEVDGLKLGLDSRYVYLFGLKIPTLLLALLPLPAGNFDQAKAYQHLMDLRADIYQAAQRAETTEEFKQAVKDIRTRKEHERELRRNQRELPAPRDSTP